MLKSIVVYLLIINIIALLAIVFDKSAARNGQERVRESSLLLLAIIGGSVGMYFAMLVFCHKTRKKKFAIGVPILLILHIIAFVLWYFKIF